MAAEGRQRLGLTKVSPSQPQPTPAPMTSRSRRIPCSSSPPYLSNRPQPAAPTMKAIYQTRVQSVRKGEYFLLRFGLFPVYPPEDKHRGYSGTLGPAPNGACN